jgi:hypothetical protein
MCKNHDQLHYPPNIRAAANIAARGHGEDRDLLLEAWSYTGLVDWMQMYGDDAPYHRQIAIYNCIRAERKRLQDRFDELIERLVQDWQDDIDKQLDSVPF